jgi:ABC-type transport system substrate-binding protein
MKTKRWLVIVPVALLLLFLQSPFWVPNYESQAELGEGRLGTFIESGIGDPTKINPIISSDAAAGQIEGAIFEGLINVDEDQSFVGDLALRWETTEVAFLAILPGRKLPDGVVASADVVAERLRAAVAAGRVRVDGESVVTDIAVLPAEERETSVTLVEEDDQGRPTPREVQVRVEVPPRVELTLDRVVPDLFDLLEPILGSEVLDEDGVAALVEPADPADREAIAPKLPELLAVREHNPVLTFFLRPDVTFHDGHVFDAGDVVFTWQAYVDPRNASARTSSWEPIKDIEVIDDLTVRVQYKRLYSPAILTWASGIMPEHLLGKAGLEAEMDRRGITGAARESFTLRNSDFSDHPVGTGAYRFAEWRKDEYVKLRRYDGHWDAPPRIETVYIRTIPETITQELEFAAGAVDYYEVYPHQVKRYREDDRYQTVSTPTESYSYIGYNLRKPLFADVRVRRALGMAIDVDALIEFTLYGEGQPISGPSYVTTPYYDWDAPLLPYDPEGAKQLLAEAGWSPGEDGILEKDGERFEFTLITNNGNPNRKAILTVAQQAWKKLGIDARIQVFEWTVFLEDFVNPLEFDAIVLGWTGGGMNPDKTQLWHSSQTHPYQLNFTGYENDEVDALLGEIQVEYDLDRQAELARRMHAIIGADQPYTFLYAPVKTAVMDRRLVQMEEEGEGYGPITPVLGSIKFHFERWRKLSTDPMIDEES